MAKKSHGKAYNTDAEALEDAKIRWAKEKYDAEMKMHVETAAQLGMTLEEWLKERERRLAGTRDRRETIYGEVARSTGPLVNGSEPWHDEYRKMCVDGNQAILSKQLKPADLAKDILTAFGDVLSPTAKARWQHIAGQEVEA